MPWLPVSSEFGSAPLAGKTAIVQKNPPKEKLKDPAYGFYAASFGSRPQPTKTPSSSSRTAQHNDIYALIRAIQVKNIQDALRLIDTGIDINFHGLDNRTALMEAAIIGSSPAVRHLIKRNANLFALDNQGRSALMLAMQYNQVNVAFILQDAIIDAVRDILKDPHCPEAKRLMAYLGIHC